jgi:hypothetical protein
VRTFEARYPGRCAAGDPIAPGDEVVYDADDHLRHVACLPYADVPAGYYVTEDPDRGEVLVPRPDPAVCGRCWTVHRGECL